MKTSAVDVSGKEILKKTKKVAKVKLQCWMWLSALFYTLIFNINQSGSTLIKVNYSHSQIKGN